MVDRLGRGGVWRAWFVWFGDVVWCGGGVEGCVVCDVDELIRLVCVVVVVWFGPCGNGGDVRIVGRCGV